MILPKNEKTYNYSNTIVNMVTTIQISEELRDELNSFKKSKKDTYEDIIKKGLEKMKLENEESLMKEAYTKYAKEDLEITKDWKKIDYLDWD